MHREKRICRADQNLFTPKTKTGGIYQAVLQHLRCNLSARLKRRGDIADRKRADMRDHFTAAKVAVGLHLVGGGAPDACVIRQIDGIGDQCRGNIGGGGILAQHRHAVGNAKRQAAPALPAGGNAANAGIMADVDKAKIGTIKASHGSSKRPARFKVKRDIAAIVHIGTRQRTGGNHHCQNLIRHRAGNRCHMGDKASTGMWAHRTIHPARHPPQRFFRGFCHGTTQQRQFAYQFFQNGIKPFRRRLECPLSGILPAGICADDQINRAVLQMQPTAVTQQQGDRTVHYLALQG